MEVLDAIEQHATSNGVPNVPIHITDCGIFHPLVDPGAGYWYDQPDEDSFNGFSPVFMVLPRVAVLAPNQAVMNKFQKAMGGKAVITCISTAEFSEESMQMSRINELLGHFTVDVLLIAPVCKGIISQIMLPESWLDEGISMAEVVAEAKPVDALSTVRTKTWLVKKDWRLH